MSEYFALNKVMQSFLLMLFFKRYLILEAWDIVNHIFAKFVITIGN